MMRGNDELDMEDIRFLANTDKVTITEIETAFVSVKIPQDIPELKEAFQRAIPFVRNIISDL
jgi:hypothetical protein